jgi:hypothetical protein
MLPADSTSGKPCSTVKRDVERERVAADPPLPVSRARASASPGFAENVLALQRSAGNAAVTSLLQRQGTATTPLATLPQLPAGPKPLFTFFGAGTFKAVVEEKVARDLGYVEIVSVKAEAEGRLELGGDRMADPNQRMTYGKGDTQVRLNIVGENKQAAGSTESRYTPGVELELKHKLDKELPGIVQALTPNKAKAKVTTDGGSVALEGDASGTPLENEYVDFTLAFNLVEWKWNELPKVGTLEAKGKTKTFKIPIVIDALGGQVGAVSISVALAVKLKPNYLRIATDLAKSKAATSTLEWVAASGGAMEVGVIAGAAAIPVVSWISYWKTVSEGAGIARLTGQPVQPVRDFALSYYNTWVGLPPVPTQAGFAGAAAASQRMPNPDPQSPEVMTHRSRDLYAEGWDLAWPEVRKQIEAAYFEEYGGDGTLLIRVLDSIGRRKGR